MVSAARNQIVLAVLVLVWYGSSMLSATSSKQILVGGPDVGLLQGEKFSALELTWIQMTVSCLCAAMASVVAHGGRIAQLVPKSVDLVQRIVSLAVVFSTGLITLNLAYGEMSTSLANTLRAAEPLSALALATANGASVPIPQALAVLPIVFGACLASYGNVSFTVLGLAYCVVANFAFAYRTVQYKAIRVLYDVNHATLFAQTCFFSAVFFAGLLRMLEPVEDLQRHIAQVVGSGSTLLLRTLAFNGFTFFLYLQLSFATLSYVTVVTHAILNSFRRPAVILFDVVMFGTVLSLVNMLGVAIACIGVAIYSLIKASAAAKPKAT